MSGAQFSQKAYMRHAPHDATSNGTPEHAVCSSGALSTACVLRSSCPCTDWSDTADKRRSPRAPDTRRCKSGMGLCRRSAQKSAPALGPPREAEAPPGDMPKPNHAKPLGDWTVNGLNFLAAVGASPPAWIRIAVLRDGAGENVRRSSLLSWHIL